MRSITENATRPEARADHLQQSAAFRPFRGRSCHSREVYAGTPRVVGEPITDWVRSRLRKRASLAPVYFGLKVAAGLDRTARMPKLP